jgi:hypothetical protein
MSEMWACACQSVLFHVQPAAMVASMGLLLALSFTMNKIGIALICHDPQPLGALMSQKYRKNGGWLLGLPTSTPHRPKLNGKHQRFDVKLGQSLSI